MMKKCVLIILSCILVAPLSAQYISREEMLALLEENNYRAAAGHNPYETPQCHDTPAPRGFKPVYVSHYGRHGSRYQGSRHFFEKVLPLLDSLSKSGLLTADGDSLRYELHLMDEAHDDHDALLTQKGSREQRELARRLCGRVPKLFRQKKACEVRASSTSAVRCLQSMANFVTEIKGFSPDLEITYDTGLAKHLHYLAPRVAEEDRNFVKSHYVPLQDSLLSVTAAVGSVSGRFFTDVDKVEAILAGRELGRFVYEIYEAAQGAACLDIKVDPLRFFTVEELYDFLEIRNLYFCANYGPLAPTLQVRSKAAMPLLRGIVKEADAALAGNGRCADLRFGHDGGLGPLLMLIGVENFDKGVNPEHALAQWQAWKYIPMCSNVQIIFYRNRKGDVLVKFLRNENETRIHSLTPVDGVYYKWQDVRRYFLTRTGDYKELPAYYTDYLDAKADEIKALQHDEADGFLFWTDSHFPDNAGNAAAVIEYLQGKTGPVKLFFGGDVAKNADCLKGGIDAATSSFLQAGLYAELFLVRGNHDFTSTTSRAVTRPQTMGNLEVYRYLSSFMSGAAVTDESACCPNYYYVDSPKGKIRYLVLDSTDSVSDLRVRYGISDKQMKWAASQAMGSMPKGWGLVVLSHVPLAPDHTDHPSLLQAGKNIAGCDNALICICGHRHADMEAGIGTLFQVLTAADCLDDMGKTVTSYSIHPGKKQAGMITEQTLDYVSISRDHSKVTFKRIGWGYDRIFNVRLLRGELGQHLTLKSILPGEVKWYAYDAEGSKVGGYKADGLRDYITSSSSAFISQEGTLECLSSGQVIAVALSGNGSREYFMVDVLQTE